MRISYDHENQISKVHAAKKGPKQVLSIVKKLHLPGSIVLNSNKLQIRWSYETVIIIGHLWESSGSTFIVGS